ncbi:MAG: hypothetical protein WAK62_12130 [Terriglobales bacterium]
MHRRETDEIVGGYEMERNVIPARQRTRYQDFLNQVGLYVSRMVRESRGSQVVGSLAGPEVEQS